MFWEEIKELDLEGRCVVTVHADFILFNVYAPALTIETEIEDRMLLKVKWFQVTLQLCSLLTFFSDSRYLCSSVSSERV